MKVLVVCLLAATWSGNALAQPPGTTFTEAGFICNIVNYLLNIEYFGMLLLLTPFLFLTCSAVINC